MTTEQQADFAVKLMKRYGREADGPTELIISAFGPYAGEVTWIWPPWGQGLYLGHGRHRARPLCLTPLHLPLRQRQRDNRKPGCCSNMPGGCQDLCEMGFSYSEGIQVRRNLIYETKQR